MVRPVIKFDNRSTEMEIKALKLSSDMKDNLRAPAIWEKPVSAVYNYHYEIGGLYYQPMIRYCVEKEAGLARRQVDLPDRLQSNYDKRSYRIKDEKPNYGDILVQMYQRRLKSNNSKSIHCAYEGAKMSKESTDLGIVTDTGSMRDKYLAQLQLMYTERLAKKGQLKGLVVETSEEEEEPQRELRALKKAEEERRFANRMLASKKNDARYGPLFERIIVLDSEKYNMGEEVDFLEGCGVTPQSGVGASEEKLSKSYRMIKTVNGEVVEDTSGANRRSFINRDYLAADNMSQFLAVNATELAAANKPDDSKAGADMHLDTTLSRAQHDVRNRVKEAGNRMLEQKLSITDMNFNYRGRKVEDIGNFERAFVRSDMYKKPALPDFDVGYDVV